VENFTADVFSCLKIQTYHFFPTIRIIMPFCLNENTFVRRMREKFAFVWKKFQRGKFIHQRRSTFFSALTTVYFLFEAMEKHVG
jgi:hypothetical protein